MYYNCFFESDISLVVVFYGALAQCLFVLFWFPPCHVSSLYGHISMYLVMLKYDYIFDYGTLDFQVSLINWIFFEIYAKVYLYS